MRDAKRRFVAVKVHEIIGAVVVTGLSLRESIFAVKVTIIMSLIIGQQSIHWGERW